MVGQQRLQISGLQFDKFSTPSSCMYWMVRFKIHVSSCSDFPSEAMLWIKEVEMVDSLDEQKSSWSVYGYTHFPIFWDAGREDCFCSEQDHPWIPTAKRRSVRKNRKLRKRIGFFEGDRPLTWFTATFLLLVLMIPLLTMRIYSLSLFVMRMFRTSIRDGTKFCCLCQNFHPMISWKVCTIKDTCVWSTQNRVRIVRQGHSSKEIDAQ